MGLSSLNASRVFILLLFLLMTGLTYSDVFVGSDTKLWSFFFTGTSSYATLVSDILGTFLWPVLILILALKPGRNRRLALVLTVSLIIAQLLRMSFSEFLPRDGPLIAERIGSTFPSGHTARAFAAATVLFVGFAGRGRWLFVVLGLGSGVSRLLLGVHFVTDVVGGALLGMWAGTMGLLLLTNEISTQSRNDAKKISDKSEGKPVT